MVRFKNFMRYLRYRYRYRYSLADRHLKNNRRICNFVVITGSDNSFPELFGDHVLCLRLNAQILNAQWFIYGS